MHITELRIAGFKSFVDPQDLLVEPGLTGIVGPNGCGKSNLLEALRWVMGASSARAMRGGEMDDLIFSGADGRPARETAEVTLVLDNQDRTAPAEFNSSDTLEVLRRLKRGAGSTYKLNGRTVRGKDIQLLFADASTGANSPSLVRQGQISELIASKPQNRRRILEEAAGIGGLNSRRHEAELKLRAAETNLERLTEVSAEVERQLESLKRQARKARKYKTLSDEIGALEAYSAHLKWEAAKAGLMAAKEQLTKYAGEVEQLTRSVAVAETERLAAGDGIAPLREAESLAAAKLGQARIAHARLETEQKTAADAQARLEAEAQRLIEDMEREQASITEAEAAVETAREELSALPSEDASSDADKETAAREALETAREQLRAAEVRADTAQQALSEARARQHAAQSTRAAAQKRFDEAVRQEQSARAQLDSLPVLHALQSTLQDAERRENASEIAQQDGERALDAAEYAVAEAREAEAAHEPGRAEADQALRELDAEIGGLKRLLKKAENVNAPPVIERVRTKEGFEKAVAAALGDDLQAPTDDRAAQFWGGAEPSRAPLPLGAKPMIHLVDAPPELQARLSQCGVVDAEEGPRIAKQLAIGQRLVSREGHLWRWDGFIRTPEAPVSAAERLQQQARLAEAESERPAVEAACRGALDKFETAKAARIEAESALKQIRTDVQPLQGMLNQARRALAEARQTLDRASVRRDTTTETLSRYEGERRSAEDALAATNPDSGNVNTDDLEAQLSAARQAVQTARDGETEARGRLTDLTRGREQAAKRRAGFERDLETWARRKTDAENRLEKLVTRRRAALDEAKAAGGRPEALAGELATLSDRLDTIETERKTAADAVAERETALREAESKLREAEIGASKARESLAGAKARSENYEQRLADVVEHARETFQRQPEGLLMLARAGLDEDEVETLELREAENRAMVLRRDRDALGGVNPDAEQEAEELAAHMGAQESEKADLAAAIAKLREGVDALNEEGRGRLVEAFETVNEHFKALFTALFRGGQAELRLVDADDPLASGLEIMAQPPGKRLGTLNLMSGGEQALTAAALIFAVFLSRPAPICVLDEVDAPLDDANVDRFCRMLDEMRRRTDTRFIIITHNPVTMSRMDRLFGVTMREKGVSKLVSVDLGTAEELVAAE
ncbi:MAG: chromosome segregation protein SMC [Pseudomonadota bacterium]